MPKSSCPIEGIFVSNYIASFSNSFSGVEVLEILSRTSGEFKARFIININFTKETPACMIGLLNNGMCGYCFDLITLSFNEENNVKVINAEDSYQL